MNLFKGFYFLIKFFFKQKNTNVIFFSENKSSWQHFKGIIFELDKRSINYSYIFLDKHDPAKLEIAKEKQFYLNNNYFVIIFFTFVRAKLIFMTTPDLNEFHIKKNNISKYIYIHHSICSTHMIYREKAFDSFDIICSVGSFQNKEVRCAESLRKLKKKIIIDFGYGKLDSLIRQKKNSSIAQDKIVIAPSWSNDEENLIVIEKIIEKLIQNNKIVFRPHPRSLIKQKKFIDSIVNKYEKSTLNFKIDTNENSLNYILEAKNFITDWSGAAFEYSFTNLSPVIFINTKKKINNTNYKLLNITPLEERIRSDIGVIMEKNDVNQIEQIIFELNREKKNYVEKIKQIRSNVIFNVEKSSELGTKELLKYYE